MKAGDAFEVKHEGESWVVVSTTAEGAPFTAEVTFQPGAGPPTHFHEEDERLDVLAGELMCVVEGKETRLRTGESIDLKAGTRHRIYCPKGAPVTVRARYSGSAFEAIIAELPPGDRAGFVRMARHVVITNGRGSHLTASAIRALLRVIGFVGGLFGIRARIERR